MFLGYQNNKIKFYSQQPLNQALYNLDRIEETDKEYVLVNDEYVLKDNKKYLSQLKQEKIKENDVLRDEALNQGVIYKNVLFDSDTDQKINLLAIVSTMSDEDTILWFGMENEPLECNKEDLINIGGLITQLHSYCWTKNAEIKKEIEESKTVEEVEDIEIDYNNQNIKSSEAEIKTSEIVEGKTDTVIGII